MIKLKRAYEPISKSDGTRILVDRMWPRGISKENLKIKEWMRDVAPTQDCIKEFHKTMDWKKFQTEYKKELSKNKELVNELKSIAKEKTLTLIYGFKDEEHNNAVVLKEVLER